MEKLKKVGSVILSVILWIIILLAALFAFTTLATRDSNRVANLLGYTPLAVQSDSMKPTFQKGDLIIIHTCKPENLKEGDIITFHTIIENQVALNTHRIAEIQTNGNARSYTTKGDNNAIEDLHIISDGDIVGKYIGKLPYLGYVMNFLSSSVGFLIVIVLPMLLFFIYQVYHLIMVSINLKKAVEAEEREKNGAESEDAKAAAAARAEAEAALEEAKRLKAEAEALKAEAEKRSEEKNE